MKIENILKELEIFIRTKAEESRSLWKRETCESEDIEKYGLNEFVGGKADAYEDCLDEIKRLFKAY
jgi:hypothetical protein